MNYSEALDQKFAALGFSQRYASSEAPFLFARHFGRAERYALRHAEPYWWSQEMGTLVASSAVSLPVDTEIDHGRLTNGQHFGWMWFERAVEMEHMKPFQGLLWMAVHQVSEAVSVSTYGVRAHGVPEPLETVYLDRRVTLRSAMTDFHDKDLQQQKQRAFAQMGRDPFNQASLEADTAEALLRFFVTACLWTQQTIACVQRLPAERHSRRRALKVDPQTTTTVRVVMLRRRAIDPHGVGRSTPVEWSCRWIVGGHWRQQYHPSTDERVPTWIAPYVKGPDDKPLKEPGDRVFAVVR